MKTVYHLSIERIEKNTRRGKMFLSLKYYSIYIPFFGCDANKQQSILNERFLPLEKITEIFNRLKKHIYFDYAKGPKWKNESFDKVSRTITFEKFMQFYRLRLPHDLKSRY